MIKIEQAIYGEKLGVTSGHDLLAVSDGKSELFKRISGYTDLADRPERGLLENRLFVAFSWKIISYWLRHFQIIVRGFALVGSLPMHCSSERLT